MLHAVNMPLPVQMYKSRFESRDEVQLPFPARLIFVLLFVVRRGLLKALQLTCATQQAMP